MRVLERQRRTAVLRRAAFGCLKDGFSINLTSGCLHDCVYCYAQGFRSTPKDGRVYLYRDLPASLVSHLQRLRRPPTSVSFSTASDPFQPAGEILSTALSTFEILLRRGIPVSFLTKGHIPEEIIRLFARYRYLVKARIGIVSVNEEYRRVFEPGAAKIEERFTNIQKLVAEGIETEARIDPIVPSVSDGPDDLERLLRVLRASGVKRVAVSYLILRPYLYRRLFQCLDRSLAERIVGSYKDQPWQRVITSARTRLFPKDLRAKRYELIKEMGRSLGIDVRVCGCKNPDLPFESCEPQKNWGLFSDI